MPKSEGFNGRRENNPSNFAKKWNRTGDTKTNPSCGVTKTKETKGISSTCIVHRESSSNILEDAKSRFIRNDGTLTNDGNVLAGCLVKSTCPIVRVFNCGRIFEIGSYNRQVELQKLDPDLVVGP